MNPRRKLIYDAAICFLLGAILIVSAPSLWSHLFAAEEPGDRVLTLSDDPGIAFIRSNENIAISRCIAPIEIGQTCLSQDGQLLKIDGDPVLCGTSGATVLVGNGHTLYLEWTHVSEDHLSSERRCAILILTTFATIDFSED